MCPSYMATREEAHSTRGRANVLRLAMAGRLGEAGLGDDGVHEVLDLCLECRACKAECPVGVDVARFKSEFSPTTGSGTARRSRARVLGHVARAVAMGQPLRAAVELDRAQRAGRWLNEQLLGIDRRRTLPAWHARHVRATLRADARRRRSRPQRCVALQRHLHQLLRPGDRARGARRARRRRACAPALAPQRLLRPAADLAGPARRGARRWPQRNADALYPHADARPAASCSSSRAACRRCARTRRRCCAARRSDKAQRRRRRVRAVRGVRRRMAAVDRCR